MGDYAPLIIGLLAITAVFIIFAFVVGISRINNTEIRKKLQPLAPLHHRWFVGLK